MTCQSHKIVRKQFIRFIEINEYPIRTNWVIYKGVFEINKASLNFKSFKVISHQIYTFSISGEKEKVVSKPRKGGKKDKTKDEAKKKEKDNKKKDKEENKDNSKVE